MLLWLVLSFPLLLVFGYTLMYLAFRRDERVFAGPLGLILYLALLAVPLGAVLYHEPLQVVAALRWGDWAPVWLVAGVTAGAALWAAQRTLPGTTPDAGRVSWVGPPGWPGFLVVLLPVASIVVAEEIIWRAYLLPETNFAVSALAFALHHWAFGWRHVAFSFLAGLVWGGLFLFGGLWPAIASHLAYNALAWRHMRRLSRPAHRQFLERRMPLRRDRVVLSRPSSIAGGLTVVAPPWSVVESLLPATRFALLPCRYLMLQPHPSLHRRAFLQVGASSLLGLGLPSLLAGREASSGRDAERGKPRSVILVLLTGGMSHLDTLDMKPEAPAEVRGEFKPMRTAVSGIQVCEHLPRLAARMERWALVPRPIWIDG